MTKAYIVGLLCSLLAIGCGVEHDRSRAVDYVRTAVYVLYLRPNPGPICYTFMNNSYNSYQMVAIDCALIANEPSVQVLR